MPNKLKFILLLIHLIPAVAFASKVSEYPVNEIADSLKKNAGAVVRYDKVTLNIQSIHKYAYTEEKIITVLNSSQESEAVIKVWYDDRTTIKSFKAWLLDAEGNMVKQFNKQDAQDYSTTPGFVMVSTERAKVWDMKKLKPPYTIKYNYETETKGTFQLPEWRPADDVGISIEHANFELTCGEDVSINYEVAKVGSRITDNHNFQWDVSGFSALKKDDYAPAIWPRLPHVYLMSKKFEVYGYEGSSETWNDIGIFKNALTKGREALDSITDSKLSGIINSTSDKREKIKLLYKYLQDNC